jgi:hypothetical protein
MSIAYPASKTNGAHMGGNWAIRVVIMGPILENHMGTIWGRWAPLHPSGPHMVFAPLTHPSGQTGISGNHPCGPHMCFASGTHLCPICANWELHVAHGYDTLRACIICVLWCTCGLYFLLFNVGYFT